MQVTFGHAVSMAAAGAGHGLKHGLALPPRPHAHAASQRERGQACGNTGGCGNTGSVQNRGTGWRHGGPRQLSADATAEIDELYSPACLVSVSTAGSAFAPELAKALGHKS